MEHLLLMMMNKYHPWVPSGSFSRKNTLQTERYKPTVTQVNHVNMLEVGGINVPLGWGPFRVNVPLLFYCQRSSVTTTPPKFGELYGYTLLSLHPSPPFLFTRSCYLFLNFFCLSPESWDYIVHHYPRHLSAAIIFEILKLLYARWW